MLLKTGEEKLKKRDLKGKTMSKSSKRKRTGLPAEYAEGALRFKTGPGWKVCYDSERGLYTAEAFQAGYYDLYEIEIGRAHV